MSSQVISNDFNLYETSNARDYIPVVSTVTGLKDILVKVYMVFVEVFPGHPASGPFNGVSEQEVSRLRYFHLVDQKSVFRCLIMLVPIIGNVFLFVFDSVNRREESEDRKSLLRKIKLNSHEFLRVDERLRNDEEFVLATLEKNQGVVPFISEELIGNDEFMWSCVFRFPQMVSLIGEKRRNDFRWACRAVDGFFSPYEQGSEFDWFGFFSPYAHGSLTDLLESVGTNVIHEPDFIIHIAEVVQRNGRYLHTVMTECLSQEKRNDGELFLKLVRVCGVDVLGYAGKELRRSEEKLRPVLEEFPEALQYASEEIKNDGDLISSILIRQKIEDVQGCGWYRFAGEELRNDLGFAEWALRELDQESLEDVFHYSTPRIRNDKGLMRSAIERSSLCYDFVGKEIEYDREIVLSAVRNRGRLLVDRDDLRNRLGGDVEIARAAVISHPDVLRFLPDEFQRSADDIAYIIKGIRGRAYGSESSDDEEGSLTERVIRYVEEIHRSAVARSEAIGRVPGGE